jgi:small subunit ribosomal protein S20
MPITLSAKKALRRDRRRAIVNRRLRDQLKKALKRARKNPTEKLLKQTNSLLDQAAKKRIIHPNKAARLKSRLSNLTPKKQNQKDDKKLKKKPLSPSLTKLS